MQAKYNWKNCLFNGFYFYNIFFSIFWILKGPSVFSFCNSTHDCQGSLVCGPRNICVCPDICKLSATWMALKLFLLLRLSLNSYVSFGRQIVVLIFFNTFQNNFLLLIFTFFCNFRSPVIKVIQYFQDFIYVYL